MQTITHYSSDSSAMTRLLVWKWTLDFVGDHPFGGGFNSFYANTITVPGTPEYPEALTRHGVAFHSIYFEVLGEHGWPGLFLFLGLIFASYAALLGAARRAKMLGMAWCRDLALTAVISLSVLVVCGAFIGIAFTPEIYYMFALPVMLRHHVRMVAQEREAAARGGIFDEVPNERYGPIAAE
jgi:O-antigen ligase